MINTHAIHDKDGFVSWLTNKPEITDLQEGMFISKLSDPVKYWPQQDDIYLKLKISDGDLFWVDTITQEQRTKIKSDEVKQERNMLLFESDWTQLADVPSETKEKWKQYRQALRDITDQPGYPFDIVWPQAPN